MNELVCLLEEASAKEMLDIILPKLLTDIHFKFITFEGKQDLRKNIKQKLKSYNIPDSKFLIMCDKDSQDCRELKEELLDSIPNGKTALVRIACHELESFYLGDLQAVESALQRLSIARLQNKAKYRTPDNLENPSQELAKITKSTYQKIAGSKAISPYLKLDDSNRSVNFKNLLNGIKNLFP